MNVTDLKHEKSVIFRDWQELHWNVIWVHELSPPQYHLSKRTDAFPNLSGSWSTAALTMIPTTRPVAHQRSQYWNYNLFSSYISSLLSRNIDQAKTLAKWKAFTLKIYSLCNNIRPEIQYKRLQSTFFCVHIHGFPMRCSFPNYSQVYFWKWLSNRDLKNFSLGSSSKWSIIWLKQIKTEGEEKDKYFGKGSLLAAPAAWLFRD